ncbi:MAG: ribosome hibernation-promoting factor, HPF/YfiA family [Flavobacteriales bacterium]
MKIKLNSVHFSADKKLVDFVQLKVGKLETFYDKIIDGEVFLRLDKSEDSANKIAEVKINIPGKELFAKKQCKSFEEAVDTAVEALRTQLTKQKTKEKPAKHVEIE